MRHYTWNGSGGVDSAEKAESIPRAGGGESIPIGTGTQPNNYDISLPRVDSVSGYSKERAGLSNGSVLRQLKEERVARLMPKTGKA